MTNGFELSFDILDPDNVPGNADFPTADFVWRLNGFETYNFYEVTDDSITLVGGVSLSGGEINFLTIYTNPEDGFQLPMTYGDNYTYYSEFDDYFLGNYIASGDRNGSVEVDGFGTLITPDGTFEDVLRLRITETSFGITNTQHAWLSAQSFIPIMVYETSTDSEQPPSVYFTNLEIVNSTQEVNESLGAIEVKTNGGSFPLTVSLESASPQKNAEWRLYTIDGRLLANTSMDEILIGENTVQLQGDESYCGLAVLSLYVEGKILSKKLHLCSLR